VTEVTDIIAHRGSKGTHPENTLAAFKEAIRVGADGIELDVQQTKDHQLVVIHDETLERTTNGQGAVGESTLAEIKQLDAGTWFIENPLVQEIPTLEEVLALLVQEKFQGFLNIELKTDKVHYEGIEQRVVTLMNTNQWAFDYMYSSFYFKSLEKIHEIDRKSKLASVFRTAAEDEQQAYQASFIEGIHPNIQWVLTHLDEVKKYPKSIRPWTVNEIEQMKLFLRYQLAGFHTDFPEKAVKLRKLLVDEG
jgi:glycerophosphoryl diester phosphodiesterase